MAHGQRASVLAAAAGLLCLLALLSEAQAQCGGFAASCNSYAFGADGIFTARCKNKGGQYVAASIDPNPHISNVDGNLVDGSNFLRSCKPTGVELFGNIVDISATCPRKSGAISNTNYDINRKVSNNNGKLVWNNCRRRSLLESTGPALAGGR